MTHVARSRDERRPDRTAAPDPSHDRSGTRRSRPARKRRAPTDPPPSAPHPGTGTRSRRSPPARPPASAPAARRASSLVPVSSARTRSARRTGVGTSNRAVLDSRSPVSRFTRLRSSTIAGESNPSSLNVRRASTSAAGGVSENDRGFGAHGIEHHPAALALGQSGQASTKRRLASAAWLPARAPVSARRMSTPAAGVGVALLRQSSGDRAETRRSAGELVGRATRRTTRSNRPRRRARRARPARSRSAPVHHVRAAASPAPRSGLARSSTCSATASIGTVRTGCGPISTKVRRPSRRRASTTGANCTVWRSLRYQYSASIVVVSTCSPVSVEYTGTSAGCGSDRRQLVEQPIAQELDLWGMRRVVDRARAWRGLRRSRRTPSTHRAPTARRRRRPPTGC